MDELEVAAEDPLGRAAAAVLGALVLASILLVDPWGWYPFGPVRWLALSVLGLAGAGLALWSAPSRLPRSLAIALVSFTAWMALAAAVGLDPLYAWTGTPERHLGWLTWVLCAVLLVAGTGLRPSGVAQLRWWLALGGAALGGITLAEALGWEPAVFDVSARLTSTFGSSAYLGAASALLLPITAGLALDRESGRARLPAVVAVLPLGVAIVGSGARSAWTGLVAAGLVLAWARRRVLRAHPRAVAGGVAVIVAVGALLLGATPMGDRVAAVTDAAEPGGRGRLDEWLVASRVLGDHLVTGVGPEGYRIAVHDGIDDHYEREHGRDVQPDRAHSGPLDVALAGGLPALAAWAAVWAAVGRAAWQQLTAGPPWLAGLAAALVAHWAGQLTLFPLAELEPVVWLLAGVLVGAGRATRPRHSGAPLAGAVVLAVAAAVALIAGVADVAADHRAEAAVDAAERGERTEAADAALDAVDLRPDIVRTRLLAAQFLISDQRGVLAGIHELDAALDISPGDPILLRARAALLVDRAEATLVPAHRETADREVSRLLDRDPSSAALWQLAERIARLEGDAAAARTTHERWLDLTPPDRRDR